MRRNYLLPKSTPLVLLASIGAQAQMNSFQPASDAALPNPDPDARVRGIIQTSTITYAVDGTQYVAVAAGNGLFVFALED